MVSRRPRLTVCPTPSASRVIRKRSELAGPPADPRQFPCPDEHPELALSGVNGSYEKELVNQVQVSLIKREGVKSRLWSQASWV